jgi:hypothetical protein
VKELRLEPATGGAVLRIVLEGPAGQVKDFALQDPARIVLDLYRPKDGAGRRVRRAGPPPSRSVSSCSMRAMGGMTRAPPAPPESRKRKWCSTSPGAWRE